MIRLIAIDLDDTLLGDDLKISERTKEVIGECIARGIAVTISTGRMLRTALPFIQELEIKAPVITYNGALVAEPVSGNILHHSPLPVECAREVVLAARRRQLPLNVYIGEELYVELITCDVEAYSRKYNIPLTITDDLLLSLNKEPTKLLAIGSPGILLDFERELREEFGHGLHITRSKPQYSEIMKAGVSKGQGLAFLSRYLRVPRGEIMAIGDSYNDIEMLEFAGLAVAVANASDHVKGYADFIAPSNQEEGVRWAIEKLVLDRRK